MTDHEMREWAIAYICVVGFVIVMVVLIFGITVLINSFAQ